MIKAGMAFLLALLLLISAGTVFSADFAKEGSGEYRSGKSGTSTVMVMGKERMQMNFEQLGAVVIAPENSPFQNATFRVLGTLHGYKGKWKSTSFVEYTCTNGDKIYATAEAEGIVGKGTTKSILNMVGGTGACTGIEGTVEMKGTPGLKASKKGTHQGVSVGTVTWKIP